MSKSDFKATLFNWTNLVQSSELLLVSGTKKKRLGIFLIGLSSTAKKIHEQRSASCGNPSSMVEEWWTGGPISFRSTITQNYCLFFRHKCSKYSMKHSFSVQTLRSKTFHVGDTNWPLFYWPQGFFFSSAAGEEAGRRGRGREGRGKKWRAPCSALLCSAASRLSAAQSRRLECSSQQRQQHNNLPPPPSSGI